MEEARERKKKGKTNRQNKQEVFKAKIIERMKEMGLWSKELEEEIPGKWDEFDNYVVMNRRFFKDKRWLEAGPDFWEVVSKFALGGKSIALAGRIKQDGFRSPDATILFGPSPWAEFKDNGISYSWNIERTMFCMGNSPERRRVAGLACAGEIIVDMFAGIGYFTLPYLVHAGAQKVVACEWNPTSIEALKRNLEKNRVAEKCEVRQGDVRLVCPRRVAHRINLGLIPTCEEYWPVAAQALRSEGGTLHVHGNVSSFPGKLELCSVCSHLLVKIGNDPVDFSVECVNNVCRVEAINGGIGVFARRNKVEWFVWSLHVSHSFSELLSDLHDCRWKIHPVFLHRVKSYAPHIDHSVLDLSCVSLSVQ